MAINLPHNQRRDNSLAKDLKAFILNRDKTSDAPLPVYHKTLDVQVLLGELEKQLKNMDQADARVKSILSKLYELKNAILLALDRD